MRRVDEALRLSVERAVIAGAGARLERDAAGVVNVGYWTGADDAVIFAVVVPRAGRYDLSLCYACPASEAGSRFAVETEDGAAQVLVVADTGGFDRYDVFAAPRPLRLPAGETRIRVRPLVLARYALMNLRWLQLAPHEPRLAPAPPEDPTPGRPATKTPTTQAAQALRRGVAGAEVALLGRVVAVAATEAPPPGVGGDQGPVRRLRILDQDQTEVLVAEAAEPALIAQAVAALRAGTLVVAQGQVVTHGRQPRLRLQGLRPPARAGELLAADAAELQAADARLDDLVRRGALGAGLLTEALAALGLDAADPRAQALLRCDDDGAPATRLAQAARLLLLQAVSAAEVPVGGRRIHAAVLGAVPPTLSALAGVLSLADADLAPRGAALRGRVQLAEGGYTATPGGLARLDGGTWALPLDQASWRSAAVRGCLMEVLDGRVQIPAGGVLAAPLWGPARCAVLLHGRRRALLALTQLRGRRAAAQLAAALALSLDGVVHLDGAEEPDGEDPAGAEAPPALSTAAQRRVRVLLARLLERAPRVALDAVAGELAALQGALEQTARALVGPLLPEELAAAGLQRQRLAAARLTVAAARLRGAAMAEPEDVDEASRVLAFQVQHLRWLRHELLGSTGALEDGDLGEEHAEALGARFAERLQRYSARPVEAEALVAEATAVTWSAQGDAQEDPAARADTGVGEDSGEQDPPHDDQGEGASSHLPDAASADEPDWTEEQG